MKCIYKVEKSKKNYAVASFPWPRKIFYRPKIIENTAKSSFAVIDNMIFDSE